MGMSSLSLGRPRKDWSIVRLHVFLPSGPHKLWIERNPPIILRKNWVKVCLCCDVSTEGNSVFFSHLFFPSLVIYFFPGCLISQGSLPISAMLRESFQYFLWDGLCLSFIIIFSRIIPSPFCMHFLLLEEAYCLCLYFVFFYFWTLLPCMCRISLFFLGQDMSVPKSDIRKNQWLELRLTFFPRLWELFTDKISLLSMLFGFLS